MKISLRYFAAVREALGKSDETLEVPAEVRDITALHGFLRGRGGIWAETLAEGRAVRIAYNHVMLNPCDVAGAMLEDGCEVAFFPPVTGG